jgi:hypothetical protein
LNQDPVRPTQLYSYSLNQPSAAATFTRLVKFPRPNSFLASTQLLTSNTLERSAFNLSLTELGTANFDQLSEVFYLVKPRVLSEAATTLNLATGASALPILPTASPTATPLPTPTPTGSPTPTPTPTPGTSSDGRFDERYSGTINVGQGSVSVPFELRRPNLDAQINQNHGDQQIAFDLLDENGTLIRTASGQKIQMSGLAAGQYIYRVRGNVSKPVDFTIKSGQGK